MLRLQKHVGGLVRATFSKSITNQAGPLLEVHYDRWTRLAPDLALPENAQVDWLNGVARAPAAWDLQLDPDAIVLFDAERQEWIDLDSSDLFMLPDVRRSMTLHQIMNHVENWMQTKASPGLPERINFEDLRFAFLPSDLKPPSPFEEAVAAAAPTEGQSVLYHRADGSTARASVRRGIWILDGPRRFLETGNCSPLCFRTGTAPFFFGPWELGILESGNCDHFTGTACMHVSRNA
jgi:hypothetical protein